MTTTKWVYLFSEGNASMRELLGGKGAGVAEMTRTGVPVPPGFTITTAACNAYYEEGKQFPDQMWEQALVGLQNIESLTGKRFGDPANPLLVSVRSGARESMPGMMDTVLNLGLNEETLKGLAALTENPRFAADAYRRFVQMFGKIVLDIDGELFEHIMDEAKGHGQRQDTDLSTEELSAITIQFKQIILEQTGQPFPDDPFVQLRLAISAVFNSWMGRRAIDYRRIEKIPDNIGTAVNVQAMVFGNMGNDSATGVAFSRNPATGEKLLYGEYLVNAQGEDVVAGIRTPNPLVKMAEDLPESYAAFQNIAQQLEAHYRDVQDMEFTIERGKLWMLQTRSGKRTGMAAVRIAVDMVNEGVISKEEALMRVKPDMLNQFLFPIVDPVAAEHSQRLAKGLAAGPGAASGVICLEPDRACELAEQGVSVILVRTETAPEDFHGMVSAAAVVTARGGLTSHAAVVARQMGKCCVCGVDLLQIDYKKRTVQIRGTDLVFNEGDSITVDGHSGTIYAGNIPTSESEVIQIVRGKLTAEESEQYRYFTTFLSWADEVRVLGVRANADSPTDARVAREFGAGGIGLCRTEHMFFEGDRIDAVREMILAANEEERRAALAKLEPLQQGDFEGLFTAMNGNPVTIRTLDPPLHEFLPHNDEEIQDLAQKMGISASELKLKVQELSEANPMLGFRGCRLGIIYPEITEMQISAIFKAAANCQARGIAVHPEIMIPLVNDVSELRTQAEVVHRVAREIQESTGQQINFLIGTMIELPRAALTANKIAEVAQFFSFGTNDLTQTTLGLSRDDAGRFLPGYIERKLFKHDPFQVLDQEGVGQLVHLGTERGRTTRNELKVGICGEHGGEPSSIEFCHRTGLNYVSCSPYRVPIARLAAAQAAIAETY
jgi:pyruvate,orthophosphate dikinase